MSDPARAQTIGPSFWGIQINNPGVTPFPTWPVSIARIWDSKFGTVACNWSGTEPSRGVYDWTCVDRSIAMYQALGLDMIYTFGRVPQWANNRTNYAVPPVNMQDLYDFQTAVVRHAAGRIKYFECWNEPNESIFWAGTTPQLLSICQKLYTTVRALAPRSLLLTPGPSGRSSMTWLQGYFAGGGGQYADIFNFHVYATDLAWPSQPPEVVWGLLNSYRLLRDHYAPGLPLFSDEGGYGMNAWLGNDPALEAAYVGAYVSLLASAGVQRMIWYAYDSPTWGTLSDGAGHLTAAGLAYRGVQGWLNGATFAQKITRQAKPNLITNPNLTGAVPGTPGRPPQHWSVRNNDLANGMTTAIVGTGTDSGMPYMDWRIQGTPTATAAKYLQLYFDSNTAIPALPNQYWTSCIYMSLKAGQLNPNDYLTLSFIQLNAAGIYQTQARVSIKIPVTQSPLSAQHYCSTVQALSPATAYVVPMLTFNYFVGENIDMTLRVGQPSMDNGTLWTGVIQRNTSSSSYHARIAWDASGGPTPWSFPTYTSYRTVTGASVPIVGGRVTLTNSPILMEHFGP